MPNRTQQTRKQLNDFLNNIERRGAGTLIDRRAEKRTVYPTGVRFQRLDANRKPFGEPSFAVVRDISLHGIGLISNQPVPIGPIEVALKLDSGQRIHLTVDILRCDATEPEMFESGGRIHWLDEDHSD